MIVNTIISPGLATLPMVAFFALALGFFLAKNKKAYGAVTLKGLQNSMFGTIAMAFIFAGILAQLLRQSGLIEALIWLVAKFDLNTGLIPLIAFLTCVLISTSCGTSTGSVTAVAPVLLPLAQSLNIDLGLMCGAIISGAIFGDNLAPISDTTIGSALTQEADLGKVVRTRFPYAVISAVISAVLFAIVGLSMSTGIPARAGARRLHGALPGAARAAHNHGHTHAPGLGSHRHAHNLQHSRRRPQPGAGHHRL